MGRTRRRAAAVIGAAAIGGLLVHVDAASAAGGTQDFTFTHTSGQRVTCEILWGFSDDRDHQGHVTAFTKVTSTDPRCEAGVDAGLAYEDVYGNQQSAQASGDQDALLEVYHVGADFGSVHHVYFAQCQHTSTNDCWTGEVFNANSK